jgi:hypothetical protein
MVAVMLPSELVVPLTETGVPTVRSLDEPLVVFKIWVVSETTTIREPALVPDEVAVIPFPVKAMVMVLPSLLKICPLIKPPPVAPAAPVRPAKLPLPAAPLYAVVRAVVDAAAPCILPNKKPRPPATMIAMMT